MAIGARVAVNINLNFEGGGERSRNLID